MHRIDDFADVADACARGCVHLQHIHMPPFGNRLTGFTLAAWLGGGAALAIGANAV